MVLLIIACAISNPVLSFDIELDTVYFPDHYSTCVTFSTDEDMDYIKGFKPKFEDTQV